MTAKKKKEKNRVKELREETLFLKRKNRLFLESNVAKTKDYSLISGPQLWPLTITTSGATSGSPEVRKTDQSDIIERYRGWFKLEK